MMSILKSIAKIVLVAVIALHLAPLLVWLLGLIGYLNAGNSYVAYVNTPNHPESVEYLEELNQRGFGEVVKSSGTRPIFIVEDDINKIKDNPRYLLGVTWAMAPYCLIVMEKNLTPESFRTTLWHEYLHCFYYGHSDKVDDIMAASYDPRMNEDTIDNYLKDLNKLYE